MNFTKFLFFYTTIDFRFLLNRFDMGLLPFERNKFQLGWLSMVIFLIFFTGCSKYCPVSGKVTYPDGTPVTAGNVIFATEKLQAKGGIKSDGSYILSSIKPGDGVLPGVYHVYLDSMMSSTTTSSVDKKGRTVVSVKNQPITKASFCSPASGITCEVKKKTVFNFTVDPP